MANLFLEVPSTYLIIQHIYPCLAESARNFVNTFTARVQCVSGLAGDFASLCRRSTEFHFPAVETQLETVRADVKKASHWRKEFWTRKAEAEALYQNTGTDSAAEEMAKRDFSVLQPGDFYLTRHSNLCETHVVFHLVADTSEQDNNITSRCVGQ